MKSNVRKRLTGVRCRAKWTRFKQIMLNLSGINYNKISTNYVNRLETERTGSYEAIFTDHYYRCFHPSRGICPGSSQITAGPDYRCYFQYELDAAGRPAFLSFKVQWSGGTVGNLFSPRQCYNAPASESWGKGRLFVEQAWF